jgi:hypothetical protein
VVESQKKAVASIGDHLEKAAATGYRFGETIQMSETETVTLTVTKGSAETKLVVLYDVAI